VAADLRGGRGIIKPLKWYRDLQTQKGRREAQAFLVEGERAISQIVNYHPSSIQEILIEESRPAAAWQGFGLRVVDSRQFAGISTTHTPQGVAAVVTLPEQCFGDTLPSAAGDRILYLEDIQDPGNVGTLIRTAAALGWNGVVLSDKCADPFAPKVVQASAGSLLALWLRKTASALPLVKELQGSGYRLFAAAGGVKGAPPSKVQGPLVLALGNEGNGLAEQTIRMADRLCTIPINPQAVESLNVAVAGAICMYAL
jgi:TrmH family RNA methyltransferase